MPLRARHCSHTTWAQRLSGTRQQYTKHQGDARSKNTCSIYTYVRIIFTLMSAVHRPIAHRATDSTASCYIPRNILSFPIVYVPQTTSSRLFVFFPAVTLLTMKETTSSCCGKEYWGSQYVVSRYSVFREGRVRSDGWSNIDTWARKSPTHVEGQWRSSSQRGWSGGEKRQEQYVSLHTVCGECHSKKIRVSSSLWMWTQSHTPTAQNHKNHTSLN